MRHEQLEVADRARAEGVEERWERETRDSLERDVAGLELPGVGDGRGEERAEGVEARLVVAGRGGRVLQGEELERDGMGACDERRGQGVAEGRESILERLDGLTAV